MKISLKIFILLSFLMCQWQQMSAENIPGYPITPVPFTAVHISSGFWAQRLIAAQKVTIPLAFSKCETEGRYSNFVKAATLCDTFRVGGFPFDDTDVYKTIEGASYSMQTCPDPLMDKYIDSVLLLVAAAQEPDGYLNTGHTMNPKHPHSWMSTNRWEKVENGSHELYNLGHMVEAAVAHYQATGKRNFLDIAIKYADCVCREIGIGEGKLPIVPGHQIAEMALVRLYLVTGNRKYLEQAKYFLDWRGRTAKRQEYTQSHKPVVEQDEAVGHAVRAGYMYAGMADVAALTGDSAYIRAIDRIWNNIVYKKLYLTGGVGATRHGEAFGKNYELPNHTAYCETCAAIANVYVNYRLFLLHGDARYFDVLERTLYNGVISGMSCDGGHFFYPNPLESHGEHERQPWFGCACCPSNLCRFIPSVPGYMYAIKDDNLYVNLFMQNEAEVAMAGTSVKLSQKTDYPWDGHVCIKVSPKQKKQFTLQIRVPGWVCGQVVPSNLYSYVDNKKLAYTIYVNGKLQTAELKNGYFAMTRKWKKGDKVDICYDMEPRLVAANPSVEADRGCVAVERGPLVYCAEWPDNTQHVLTAEIHPANVKFTVTDNPILGGIKTISTEQLTLIPYYAWAHRGKGNMAVWIKANIK